jgi:hypothetical protein
MRDIAIEIDRNLMEPRQSARRRCCGDMRNWRKPQETRRERLDAWRLLLAGLNPTAPEWFEARYHSLRLLLLTDRPAAGASDFTVQSSSS